MAALLSESDGDMRTRDAPRRDRRVEHPWPTLRATVFSYHEVWHVFTLVAAAAQFTAIWLLTT